MRTSQKIGWLVRLLIVLAVILGAGCCRTVTAPPPGELPPGQFIDTPAEYTGWWAEVEQCSRLHGELSRIRVYITPGGGFDYNGHRYLGYYEPAGHIVILANAGSMLPSVVGHEFLHGLLSPRSGHPPEYFRDRCGTVVAQSTEPN